jgi:hypothetical protein
MPAIKVRLPRGKLDEEGNVRTVLKRVETTVGRALLSEICPGAALRAGQQAAEQEGRFPA